METSHFVIFQVLSCLLISPSCTWMVPFSLHKQWCARPKRWNYMGWFLNLFLLTSQGRNFCLCYEEISPVFSWLVSFPLLIQMTNKYKTRYVLQHNFITSHSLVILSVQPPLSVNLHFFEHQCWNPCDYLLISGTYLIFKHFQQIFETIIW